ncbi:N-acetyl-alpha-D-glucosaminyl-diphospho-ditrans, octacis-undecaprenol 3-alpha-mannosyltransferase/rhamnosyltransferase [Methylomarinovum caldicuralii]|uniref:N-acetyl-alpha-D-glucosaminyl-diphospho-ditrans, octacis-undecaprenol 3-alpha-mannosyltransferase/rhamnosyltransferase n=1 Tax=Methylomarinovum caldicuralii TaxID=438856 RepID=A0AAU9BQE7_9GAMM|nr:glycosyltransferase family 2 protein [Methylomarinovum caldicuralii]BCX80928.1 N-acetyl-alpha-D-glucosaminyl-diphospho-ditrans, octacis-undecaprenol 3-alpha-mannosyltransferase/rhamnosyltransferase [Methylomarinovum caldicuralii]
MRLTPEQVATIRRVVRETAANRHLAVVMPARDEAAVIAGVIASVSRHLPGSPVIVVDDASADGTAAVAEQAGAVVLRLPVPLGAWGAIQTGMRYALKQGFDAVVTMDADGQHLAEEIPKLLKIRDQDGADVVIGAYPERGSRARRLAWSLFRRLSGFSLADLTSGFRIYSRRALWLLASPRATLLEYQDLGVLILMRSSGLKIVETAVIMRPRLAGKSRVFSSWWRVALYMAQTVLLLLACAHHRRRFKSG